MLRKQQAAELSSIKFEKQDWGGRGGGGALQGDVLSHQACNALQGREPGIHQNRGPVCMENVEGAGRQGGEVGGVGTVASLRSPHGTVYTTVDC